MDGEAKTAASGAQSPDADNAEPSLVDLYGPDAKDALRSGLVQQLQVALVRELDDNKLIEANPKHLPSGGLRTSLWLAGLSLALALGMILAALGSYRVNEETLFLNPSELFSTEGLLLDALKARSNLEISKRDQIIAAYEARAKLRERRANDLLGIVAVEAPSQADTLEPGEPVSDEDVVLEALNREATMLRLLYGSLNELLDTVSRSLEVSDVAAALEALRAFETTLRETPGANPAAADIALGMIESLVASIARMETRMDEGVAQREGLALALDDAVQQKAAVEARLLALERENASLKSARSRTAISSERAIVEPGSEAQTDLLERSRVLEAENKRLELALLAALAREPERAVADKKGARFLGTVTVITGDRILVDLAPLAVLEAGDLVLLYRPSSGAEASPVGLAFVQARRGSIAELTLRGQTGAAGFVRVRDSVFSSTAAVE